MAKWAIRGCLGFVVAAAVFVGAYWYKDTRQRRQEARQALQIIRQEIIEKDKLASLGNIHTDPSQLTFGMLNELLRQPAHKLASAPTSTRLGWACGGEGCAVYGYFPIPPGKEVPSSSTPVLLYVSTIGFGKPFQGSIGGIRLGDPVDVLKNVCLQGHEAKEGTHRIFRDKDWEVGWTESKDHKVDTLLFFNKPLINALRTDQRTLH
jgi:hypothetical protein